MMGREEMDYGRHFPARPRRVSNLRLLDPGFSRIAVQRSEPEHTSAGRFWNGQPNGMDVD
jgi:hypothetical protein